MAKEEEGEVKSKSDRKNWHDNVGCCIIVATICILIGFAVHSCSEMFKPADCKCQHEDKGNLEKK